MNDIQIKRLGYAVGAQVTGVDLRRPLEAEAVRELHDAWLTHLVLCFPDQDLTAEQFIGFAGNFGELEQVRSENRDAQHPSLGYLTNQPRDGKPWSGRKGGTLWHSDDSYTTRPTSATFVLAKQIPPAGGDTMFANQYAPFANMSPALQQLLEGLSIVQDLPARPVETGEAPTVHPVVRIHPETGRKALFVGARNHKFYGMTEDESAPLLDWLNQEAVRYEYCYRHRWSTNDLIMWDNRALMHIALRDYDEQHEARHMWRCACLGDTAGFAYDESDERRVAV